MTIDPTTLSLEEIASLLADHKLTSTLLTEHCLEKRSSFLEAYKSWRPDIALKMAALADQAFSADQKLGPLQGIPLSIKDLYGIQDMEIYAGSPSALPEVWQTEGPLVEQLRHQRAVFTGKTHTVEFAFGGLGVNSHWNTPRNPWDTEVHRVPGGSSSGAGISIIEGSCLLALGSDTAGSVRIPAAMTGTVGLKTSYGRWSLAGIFPLSPTLDTAGILTRTVADALFAFAAIDPVHQHTHSTLRHHANVLCASDFVIGTNEPLLWKNCSPGVAEIVRETLSEIESFGGRVIDVPLPEVADSIELLHSGNVVAAEVGKFLGNKLPAWLKTLDPVVSARLADGISITKDEYLRRRRLLEKLQAQVQSHFDQCDVIASPTVSITPPALDDVSNVAGYRPQNLAALRNTCAGNSLGLCAITIPAGLDAAGMPVGLQLMAPHGKDDKLLCIASCIERLVGDRAVRIGCIPDIPR